MEHALKKVLDFLPSVSKYHSPHCPEYKFLEGVSFDLIKPLFDKGSPCVSDLGGFGRINLPYRDMGAIDSTHLFGLDELIIFSWYLKHRERYEKAGDLGANIGLHSILLSKAGLKVKSFEPDPTTFGWLNDNVTQNNVSEKVSAYCAAISSQKGMLEFTRVVGNLTGSHLSGSKADPYGTLEKFSVPTLPFEEVLVWADLLKVDVEGHEAEIICGSQPKNWVHVDAFIEIGSSNNAQSIFNFFAGTEINLFAQKIGWSKVNDVVDMPVSYKDGSLFVSSSDSMNW
jgi:FkbM family methyltransferase